jgi:hypothetical protein
MIRKVCNDLKIQRKKKERAENMSEKLSIIKVASLIFSLIVLILCKALMYFTIFTLRKDYNVAQ